MTMSGTKTAPAPAKANAKAKLVSSDTPFGDSLHSDMLCVLLSPFVAMFFVATCACEALVYHVSARLWPRSAPPPHPLRGVKGELAVEVFDPDVLGRKDWKRLRDEYVHRGVPFVLRRADGAPLSSVAPPAGGEATEEHAADHIRVVMMPMWQSLPGLDELCAKLLPWSPRAYWPLWFLGNYSQGQAHVDLGPHVFNCYFQCSGTKDVLLAPPEITKTLDLAPGVDGLFIPGSEGEARTYVARLPYYYRVDLAPQSMLCFNSTSTLHQFRNHPAEDGSTPQALSIRLKHTSCGEPRVWRQMTLPWRSFAPVWRFTGVFVSNTLLGHSSEDREAKYL